MSLVRWNLKSKIIKSKISKFFEFINQPPIPFRGTSRTTIPALELHESSPENIQFLLRGDLFHEIDGQLGRHSFIGNLFHHVLPFNRRDPYFHDIPDLYLPGRFHVRITDRDVTFTTFFCS